ncbi:DNA methyltransferase [Vagococcus lutrae]|nr:DNA methyltransferase [Vagococcus lutrae]GEQ63352.1 DNA methyltransferase [Vagococcus lutrae]GEQ65311.1 DNA methyltransferase [Vagococcus lutrae]
MKMKVFSMFDGVGGFTVGLNKVSSDFYQTIYSNQYEPSKKSQDAYEVGIYRFPEIQHIGKDVALITNSEFKEMAQNGVDMIVGGFPCQDYSVARSKKNEMGIEGKKGVLFWEIIRATEIIRPKYLILENVDRLLKSPSKQRGRDFAVMLAAFNKLNYSVEWRVINAADYGCAQRRRRVFFYVYRNDTGWAKNIDNIVHTQPSLSLFQEFDEKLYDDYIFNSGLFARQFPVKNEAYKEREAFGILSDDIVEVSDCFKGKIWNTGVMRYGKYYTKDTEPTFNEQPIPLKDIIQPESEVSEEFYITGDKLEKFNYLRGPKKIKRTSADGHEYIFSEGGMSPYDSLELPGRTMLTSEGTINRSTHLLKIGDRYRLITPIEAERLQGFPDNWTQFKQDELGNVTEVSNRMRMFFMGNALVTDIVQRIGLELKNIHETYPTE